MDTLVKRLECHFPFIGHRAITDADLFGLCRSRGVPVVFAREIQSGLYVRHACGDEVIFLNSQRSGVRLVYVFTHEVAHMLLHVPATPGGAAMHFDGGERCGRINHEEAETAAALLMFPRIELIDADLLENADRRFTELIARRLHFEVGTQAAFSVDSVPSVANNPNA